jgi:hypothetical protein
MYALRWKESDLDQFAGATVAGHLIECGTQVTGGISTDWLNVPDVANIGFPIVEVFEDGSCVVTKPRGTGGSVNEITVKEQLLYEIGDPDNYLSPDVAVSFLSLRVEDLGNDRVRVTGAGGKPRPESYKVSATYRDGFRAAGTLTIVGRNAVAKAKRCGELVLKRVRDAGFNLRDSVIELLGQGGAIFSTNQEPDGDPNGFGEVVLRLAIETNSADAAECFARELMPFVTAGPQGTTGYAEGRPRVHPVFRYLPWLIPRDVIVPRVEIIATADGRTSTPAVVSLPRQTKAIVAASSSERPLANVQTPTHLYDIACARSGDKGTSVNIGIIARSPAWWRFLQKWLTTDRIAEFFSSIGVGRVDRYELSNLHALNFVIHDALNPLRTDAQGKAFGQALLELRLPGDAMRTIINQ